MPPCQQNQQVSVKLSVPVSIIDEAALRAAVTPERAVAVMRKAFRADGEGRTHVPAVINLEIPSARGEFHIKTAHIEGVPHIAVKVASGFYDNPSKGLPSGSGMMALFDAATGRPAALLLDNGFLTDIRTGAAGAIAADHLARPNIHTVGVIGSGIQARHQVRCLHVVRPFARIVAWSPTRDRLDADGSSVRESLNMRNARQARMRVTAASADSRSDAPFTRPEPHTRLTSTIGENAIATP